jgi:hypothetical protein
MSVTYTADRQYYFNPAYANAFATAVLKIATGNTLTTNVDFFMNGTSALSNQVWGGIKRADIIDLGRVTAGDSLEILKNLLDSGEGDDPDSGPRAVLLVTELYSLWVANGIGYYGDSAGSPLFLESQFGLQIFDSSGTKKVEISSALIAIAGIDSVTIAANSSIQVNIPELNNSGVWKVFLDGFPYSGSYPIYTSVINPSVAYFNGYYTLTNNSTTYSWAGTAFVYRVS